MPTPKPRILSYCPPWSASDSPYAPYFQGETQGSYTGSLDSFLFRQWPDPDLISQVAISCILRPCPKIHRAQDLAQKAQIKYIIPGGPTTMTLLLQKCLTSSTPYSNTNWPLSFFLTHRPKSRRSVSLNFTPWKVGICSFIPSNSSSARTATRERISQVTSMQEMPPLLIFISFSSGRAGNTAAQYRLRFCPMVYYV